MRRRDLRTEIKWHRILGRLQRRVSLIMHPQQESPENNRSRNIYAPLPERPGMDVGPLDVGPTDPEVFRARAKVPSPERIYDVPRDVLPAALTPSDSLLNSILDDIEDIGEDVVGDMPRPTANNEATPCPSLRPSSACSEEVATYMDMSANRGPRTPPSISSEATLPAAATSRRPQHEYEMMDDPHRYTHNLSEGVRVPQGSPPPRCTRDLPLPVYCRDYYTLYTLHPDAFPAYSLICEYAWYVQVTRDVIMCGKCVTDEHIFCSFNRPRAVWRQLHIITRTFQHTDLHCCRCYKLLMKTRRAIDCYTCRLSIIDMRGRFGDLQYKIVCDTTIPRGII